jgi:probable phosphoglycerate mutase
MTTFLLVRHASCDPVGVALAGRAPGVSLNEEGRRQAARLAVALGERRDIAAVYSSPIERAWETARAIADALGLAVDVAPALTEIDFGAWTGKTFEMLDDDPAWRRFNSYRSGTRAPGGEHMLEVQARAVAEIARLGVRHEGRTVVIVTHGDVVRAIVAYYAGIPLDLLQRVEIDPASVSTLELTEDSARILQLNAMRMGLYTL